MDTEHITDFQLYALVNNDRIAGDLGHQLELELEKRLLPESEVDELKHKLESITHPSPQAPLKSYIKAFVIFFPFLVPVHAIIANLCLLTKGNNMAWMQYWHCITIGFAVWLAVFLLLIHFEM